MPALPPHAQNIVNVLRPLLLMALLPENYRLDHCSSHTCSKNLISGLQRYPWASFLKYSGPIVCQHFSPFLVQGILRALLMPLILKVIFFSSWNCPWFTSMLLQGRYMFSGFLLRFVSCHVLGFFFLNLKWVCFSGHSNGCCHNIATNSHM